MKKHYFTNILTLLVLVFPNFFISFVHAGPAEDALEIAFGGTATQNTTVATPEVLAQSVAQRAVTIQNYISEYQAQNPGTSYASAYAAATSRADTEYNSSQPVTTIVSEKIPGATCTCAAIGHEGQSECPTTLDVSQRLYSCSVSKGMTSFENLFREIIKWIIYITMLLGVLALVGSGILWAWGSESEEYTKKAKGWAVNIIIGLALLFTFRYILGFLAPWIFM